MKTAIRDAKVADVPAIIGMIEDFERWLCTLDGSVFTFNKREAERRLRLHGFGKRRRCRTLIAEAAGQPAGYAIYVPSFWADGLVPVILLSDFYVRPEFRRHGVGRALMMKLAAIGRKEGCEEVMWTVWRPNAGARKFYKAIGGRYIDDELVMMLRIKKRGRT